MNQTWFCTNSCRLNMLNAYFIFDLASVAFISVNVVAKTQTAAVSAWAGRAWAKNEMKENMGGAVVWYWLALIWLDELQAFLLHQHHSLMVTSAIEMAVRNVFFALMIQRMLITRHLLLITTVKSRRKVRLKIKLVYNDQYPNHHWRCSFVPVRAWGYLEFMRNRTVYSTKVNKAKMTGSSMALVFSEISFVSECNS